MSDRAVTSTTTPPAAKAAAPPSPVESIDRALLVVQTLAPAGATGMALAELATAVGLHKSTVHRTLAALRFRGFVSQDPASERYVLGPAATGLADEFFRDENLPALLHPALVALGGTVDELVHLGVLSGTQVVYLDKVEPERPVRVWSAVGRRSPAVTTALGRALLAFRGTDRSLLHGYVRAAERDVDLDHVWQAVEGARTRGYATEDQENEPGISCLAVPLLRGGTVLAAVSVTAPSERMTPDRLEWLHQQITAVLPRLLPTGIHLP